MRPEEHYLGDIVTKDFRAASILSEAGLDFCCGGNKTLETACREKGIGSEEILEKLEVLESQPVMPGQNFNDWQLGFLCDYIVNTHHSFVRKNIPVLSSYTKKIRDVHGDRHPELAEVSELFDKLGYDLIEHMDNEEKVLFPAIRKAVNNGDGDALKTISSEISRMHGEHESAGGTMDKINVITGHYKLPQDGCNTFAVTYNLLKQFEDDLHIHVHLENNILFPKSLKL
jgi:regulator of cell morphogenesis and NO signaling